MEGKLGKGGSLSPLTANFQIIFSPYSLINKYFSFKVQILTIKCYLSEILSNWIIA